MTRWSAKIEEGFVIVEADKYLRTFQDGIMPEWKWRWVSKRVFMASVRTIEYSDGAEETRGANMAKIQAEMEAVDDKIVDVREINGNNALRAKNYGVPNEDN